MERGGCYIASAELTPKFSKSGEGGPVYYTFVTYESRGGISKTIDLLMTYIGIHTKGIELSLRSLLLPQDVFLYWTIILRKSSCRK